MYGQCSRISECSCWTVSTVIAAVQGWTLSYINTFFYTCPGIYSELLAWASYAASHCNVHWLSFLIMFKNWSLQIPEQHKHNFSYLRLRFLLFYCLYWAFPLCTSVVDVDMCSDHSLSVTLIQPFLNMSVHLYMLHCRKMLLPYCTDGVPWISADYAFESPHTALSWCMW